MARKLQALRHHGDSSSKGDAAASNLRAVEVHESERPLYKVYRPSPAAAHSSHLIVDQDGTETARRSSSTLALPLASLSTRKQHKKHRQVNDQAALDRLLAPQFASTANGAAPWTSELAGGDGGGGGSEGGGAGTSRRPSSIGTRSSMGLGGGGGESYFQSSAAAAGGGGGAASGSNGAGGTLLARHGSGTTYSQRSGGSGGTGGTTTDSHLRRTRGNENAGGGGASTTLADSNGVGGTQRRRHHHRLSSRRSRRGGAAGDGAEDDDGQGGAGGGDDDDEEQLTSKALGVYIDGHGRVHDKEYDPFETVRNLSRRKFEKSMAFGAAREEDSEAGSDVSGGSLVGVRGGGGGGGVGVGGDDWRNISHRVREEDEDQEVAQEEHRRATLERNKSIASSKYYDAEDAQDDGEEDEEDDLRSRQQEDVTSPGLTNASSRTRSNTAFSEYDSGFSATSPRLASSKPGMTRKNGITVSGGGEDDDDEVITIHPMSLHSRVQQMQLDDMQRNGGSLSASGFLTTTGGGGATSSSAASSKRGNNSAARAYTKSAAASANTYTSPLARNEERPRALLYPQTPAQVAAAKEKAAASSSPLSPPVAPFHPTFAPKRASSVASDPLSPRPVAFGANRAGTIDGGRAGSGTVFSSHDMAYLPSRWAQGDRELRKGEEAIERYRPMEWAGSQNPTNEREWTPGCMDVVKRNWHEFTLAFRFGAHRTKKKLGRKITNM